MKYIWQRENWTEFTWQSDLLLPSLGKARQLQGEVLARGKALGIKFTDQAQAEILTEEAVKTSAIEGEALNRDSVRSSVAKHLGLPQTGLRSVDRHVDGLVEILIDATKNYNRPLTVKRLHEWHAALFPTGYSGLQKIRVGKWRNKPMQVVSGPMERHVVHFEAPPSERIDEEMHNLLVWFKTSQGVTEGLLRSAILHFWFVTIHPFDDGNGRVARALTDMALAQDEKLPVRFYSLSSQIMEERQGYYDVLEKVSKGDRDITPWLLWFLNCCSHAMEKSKTIIGKVLAKSEFWQKHSQTSLNDRQRKVINLLLDTGEGLFKGGLTTRKYVSVAKVSRATAYREITELVEKNLLRSLSGRGRSVAYDIVWP
ncbi:MAG: Fic family protein [Candidatus Omnitrophica bacterium]|nr:Fic family protein [Candidatus Omnitrophota bacterium]